MTLKCYASYASYASKNVLKTKYEITWSDGDFFLWSDDDLAEC